MKRYNFDFRKMALAVFLLIIVLVVYWGVWRGFFQQDEWAGLGNFYFIRGLPTLERLKALYTPMFKQGMGHFLPWVPVVNYVRYFLFNLIYPPYAVFAILLHIIASFLIFLLALRLCKNSWSAFLAALFFAVGSSASQAVTWVGTSLPTQLALIFSVLSIIYWLDWLNNQKSKNIWLSVSFLVLAIGFKETSLFLFLFLPIVGFLYNSQLKRKFLTIFGFIGFGYLILRFGTLVVTFGVKKAIAQTFSLFSSAIFRFIAVLLTGTMQTILSQELVLTFTDKIAQLGNLVEVLTKSESVYDSLLNNQILKLIIYVFGFLFLVVFILYTKKQKVKDRQILMFSLLWFVLAFVPLAFIQTGELDALFLAPRGLYIPVAAIAVFFALILKRLIEKKSIVLIFFISLLFIHIFVLRTQVNGFIKISTLRKEILQQIKTEYPDLPDKIIFYTESDNSFYGLPPEERIFPFQSGLGQTLLVWFQKIEQFPKEFFQDRFLWEIESQGYKETGGRGFGYFRDFDLLGQTVVKNEILPKSIIAFRYDSESKLLEDITEEVRGRIRGFESSKRLLSFNNLSLETSENSNEAYLAIDGNQNTKWDSKLEYIYPQFLVIDLRKLRNVAQVRLDSFDNKDQNAVGYRVLLSNDGEEWKQVYYVKSCPPDANGLVDLYFEPQPARFIKIEQIGKHRFASWVIYELEVYEVVE